MRTIIGFSAFAAAALAACTEPAGPGGRVGPIGPPDQESLVKVVPETASVPVGGQVQLAADSRDTSRLRIADQRVTWSSDNPGVAAVSDAGLVTGLAGGQARVQAVVGGHRGAGTVVVRIDAGQIRFATVTTGLDLPSGYYVAVDGGQPMSLDANAIATSPVLTLGDHSVLLEGVATNCLVSADNPRVVHVNAGETALVTFEVACRAFERIAFGYTWSELVVDPESGDWTWKPHSNVAVISEDGSGFGFIVADGAEPAWSPDGARIAFTCGIESDNGYRSDNPGVCVVNADGTGLVRLTSDSGDDHSPAWSPDGSTIAFVSVREGPPWLPRLYVMNADGRGAVRVTSGTAGQPAWSPDGSRIAFDCTVDANNLDTCVVHADGTGLVRLTSDPAVDRSAAWSPDGARIAFGTQRYGNDEIAVMSADGAGLGRVRAGTYGREPAWSPDGARIAFTGHDGSHFVIHVMNADGTGLVRLPQAYGSDPAWRPADHNHSLWRLP